MLADGVLCISTGQPLQLHHTLLAKKYSDGQNMAIIIDVVRARGLNPKEGQGLLLDRVRDAYCTVKVGEDERKTRTIANSLAPEWSERFEYMASGGTRQCMVSPLVYFARVYGAVRTERYMAWLGLAWLGPCPPIWSIPFSKRFLVGSASIAPLHTLRTGLVQPRQSIQSSPSFPLFCHKLCTKFRDSTLPIRNLGQRT